MLRVFTLRHTRLRNGVVLLAHVELRSFDVITNHGAYLSITSR
jgi:hypothetical protein